MTEEKKHIRDLTKLYNHQMSEKKVINKNTCNKCGKNMHYGVDTITTNASFLNIVDNRKQPKSGQAVVNICINEGCPNFLLLQISVENCAKSGIINYF